MNGCGVGILIGCTIGDCCPSCPSSPLSSSPSSSSCPTCGGKDCPEASPAASASLASRRFSLSRSRLPLFFFTCFPPAGTPTSSGSGMDAAIIGLLKYAAAAALLVAAVAVMVVGEPTEALRLRLMRNAPFC